MVLKHLIFEQKVMTPTQMRPSNVNTKQALIETLTDVIWAAGNESAKLVLSTATLSSNRVTKGLGYVVYFVKSDLRNAITINYTQFYHQENHGNGIIQLLLSIIFTRGCEMIKTDMDSFSESLIGRHSYCTQDMVNLILYGKAISNLHDGDLDIDGQIFHGIKKKCEIGQLSLFEYYDNIKVGNFCKNPIFPIYVLCSESHYTVLFSFLETSDEFDVYYYDELGNQTEDIRLTLKLVGQKTKEERKLVPPIELCLQTKHGHKVMVDWNDTEPLL
jgi:ubiquitin carboxyl-terminal hydrolase MINDY-3/4